MSLIIKGLDVFLRRINDVVNICVLIFVIAVISTDIYYSTYRNEWSLIMLFSFCIIIVYIVCSLIFAILVNLIDTKQLISIFLYKTLEKRYKVLKIEYHVFWGICLVAILIGSAMVKGNVQTFEGDPWWSVVCDLTFVYAFFSLLSKQIRMMVYDKILNLQV